MTSEPAGARFNETVFLATTKADFEELSRRFDCKNANELVKLAK